MHLPPKQAWPPLALAGFFLVFAVAAILNAGGYRYGASDQAFYVPAVLRHLDPALFPRDWGMLGAQDRFNVFTPLVAAAVRASGLSVPAVFFALFLLGLAALFGAAVGIGCRVYRSRWTVITLLAAFTLRHAVAMGAVNTLEGYMHPRVLAFAAGALAVAACLGTNRWRALLAVAVAVALHPTTGVWFALWIAIALAIANPRFAPAVTIAAAGAGGLGAWAVLAGPMAGRFTRMDGGWLSVLGSKTYLFPSEWPAGGWLPVALTVTAAAWLYALRRSRGLVTREERGVAAGAAILFAAFLVSIPITAARLALAVQLQIPRTLWMVDLLAVVYAAWFIGEWRKPAPGGQQAAIGRRRAAVRQQQAPEGKAEATHAEAVSRERRAAIPALVLVALALARGGYSLLVEHPERAFVQVGLAATPWTDAMQWIRDDTPKDAWVLADPGHAWKYGVSVRAAAARDVYLEEAKDTAMAMYSREAAMTVRERIRRVQGFETFSVEQLRALGPDVLVTDRNDLALPVLHRNAGFSVYRLR